jgi:hypothetical protein
MVRILAIADEVDESLGRPTLESLRPNLIVSCGDLPFDYLEYVVTVANVPLLYVPGNHDPDLTPRPEPAVRLPMLGAQGMLIPSTGRRPRRAVQDDRPPRGPAGCTPIDGRIVEVAGLRVAGLGGSHRYSDGPHQYTQAQMRRRALGLEVRSRLGHPGRGLDVLATHAAPLDVGDEDDRCHVGFSAFHRLVRNLRTQLLLHGHIHPYGRARPDRLMGRTRVINVIPRKLVEVEAAPSLRRRQGGQP